MTVCATPRPGALAGVKIVSMAEQYPGPLSTMTMSDLGADVIQVERPGAGDPARMFNVFYEALNRGKRSLTLDVTQEADRARLLELIDSADVFMEGFRPGKLAKFGLDWESLSARNPKLIYCSISGYGQTGPYRNRPAHDVSYQGVGGALDERLRGVVSGLAPAMLLGDTLSGLYATIGILAALQGRALTGKGTYLDISMTDTIVSSLTAFIGLGDEPGPAPPQLEPAFGLFECADGLWLTLSIAHENANWDRLMNSLGLPEFEGLRRPERVAREAELRAKVAGAIRQRTRAEWEAVFDATDQMWGPAHLLSDVRTDPQVLARGLIEQITRADGSAQWVARQPIKFSAYDNAPLTRAPRLGEHPDAAFKDKA